MQIMPSESWIYSGGGGKERGKYIKRFQEEINVLLIMFKTIYDKANFAPFHKMNTRERYLQRVSAFFNLSWN